MLRCRLPQSLPAGGARLPAREGMVRGPESQLPQDKVVTLTVETKHTIFFLKGKAIFYQQEMSL